MTSSSRPSGLEEGLVALGGLAAAGRPGVEVPELDAEDGGLEGVEPGVDADLVVVILRLHAVDPEPGELPARAGSSVVISPPSPNPPRFFDG